MFAICSFQRGDRIWTPRVDGNSPVNISPANHNLWKFYVFKGQPRNSLWNFLNMCHLQNLTAQLTTDVYFEDIYTEGWLTNVLYNRIRIVHDSRDSWDLYKLAWLPP